MRTFMLLLSLAVGSTAQAQTESGSGNQRGVPGMRRESFQVVELRRYITKEGERDHFASTFERYFPEAFKQLGAIAFGQFLERGNPAGCFWLRWFKDIDARAIVTSAFYYGPLWKEHRTEMNDRMVDSDNVLLLRPLSPERGIVVLPAVDPIREAEGARGVAVAQIFAVPEASGGAFAQEAETSFSGHPAGGGPAAHSPVTPGVTHHFPPPHGPHSLP